MAQEGSTDSTRRDFLKSGLIVGSLTAAGVYGFRKVTHWLRRDFDPARQDRVLEAVQPAARPRSLPNLVLVFVDDLGYGDLGSFGTRAIRTPHLDRMAQEGVRLTQFYSAAPLCSPSRAGLLTGRYPIRTLVTSSFYPSGSLMNLFMDLAGFYRYGVTGIPEDEVLLPELLKRRGYRTALFGKWHLGDHSPHLPTENGFDHFFGAFYSNGMEPYEIYQNQQVVLEEPVDQNLLTQQLTEGAVEFIRQSADAPFFLYLAHIMPHEPIHASADFRGGSMAGLYGDAVEELDWSTGQVLGALAEGDLEEETLVIFTSDNGPWWQGDTGGLRGRKNLPQEGGFRVPFIARWPGVIPSGHVVNAMAMNFDLFATFLALAGISPPGDRQVDGVDMLPLLTGEGDSIHRRLFYFKGPQLIGVRDGDWKYLRRHMTDNGGYTSLRQGPFLFNLSRDPHESYSLIESEPEIARRMEALLQAFDQELAVNPRGWRDFP